MAKRIAIGSWMFTTGPHAAQPENFDSVCDRAKALGFDGIELGAFPPHPNPGNPYGPNIGWAGALTDAAERAGLKARMESRGLAFSAVVANLWGERLINTGDPGRYIAEFRRNAEFARDVGAPMLRIDCVQPPTIHREVCYRTALERVVSTWRTCCDIAADYGLEVTWEFEPCYAFNKPTDLLRVHDGVDKANFGLLYDTAHAQMVAVRGARQEGLKETYPSQREFLHALEGRINHVHLNDSNDGCRKDETRHDDTSAQLPVGHGVLDYVRLLPALAKACRRSVAWWTVDLQDTEPWAAAEACKQALDPLNARFG